MANNYDCGACGGRVHGNDVHWIEDEAFCPRCAEGEYERRAAEAERMRDARGSGFRVRS